MPQHVSLLSSAVKEVKLADHLLSVSYPMSNDPRILMSVVRHSKKALKDAAGAVVLAQMEDGYEAFGDTMESFRDLHQKGLLPSDDSLKLYKELSWVEEEYDRTPQAFARSGELIISGEGFSYLEKVSAQELKRALGIVKDFVHDANRRLMLDDG